jgi:hypothetical protein
MANPDNRGNWPTIEDSPDGKTLPFSPDAIINKDTGMYQMPERKEPHGDFEAQAVGDKTMYVPIPKYKPCRMVYFTSTTTYLEVSESIDYVRSAYDEALQDDGKMWYTFTDPTYGTLLAIPRANMRTMAWVVEGWKDIDRIKEEIREIELAKSRARLQRR